MADIDIRCKGVHVKLDKETHSNFKIELVKHGVTMQDAFEEFARLLGQENVSAVRMIEKLVRDRIKEELATVGLKPSGRRAVKHVNELDSESLYDLINDENDHQSTKPGGNHDEAA